MLKPRFFFCWESPAPGHEGDAQQKKKRGLSIGKKGTAAAPAVVETEQQSDAGEDVDAVGSPAPELEADAQQKKKRVLGIRKKGAPAAAEAEQPPQNADAEAEDSAESP